jgi:hypothetical protein
MNKLKKFWMKKISLPEEEFQRFSRVGLIPQDYRLSDLEIICAISLMAQKKNVHQVQEAIERFRDETIEPRFNEEFLALFHETISEMEKSGMRSLVRTLRKIGRNMAAMQGSGRWKESFNMKLHSKSLSALRDEPFLPQKG